MKKLAADEIALLKLLHRWHEEAEKAGRRIEPADDASNRARAPHAVPRWHQHRRLYHDVRIYGEGINVAARLEGIAEPGGIFVSGKVYEEISGRFDLAFQDMGEQQLKNIARNVRVYRVRLDNVAPTPLPQLALPDKPSIAVLPFQNMSGDAKQDWTSRFN
jgi:hypothetical protein